MIWNYDAREWRFSPQDNVATLLASKHKANLGQDLDEFFAG